MISLHSWGHFTGTSSGHHFVARAWSCKTALHICGYTGYLALRDDYVLTVITALWTRLAHAQHWLHVSPDFTFPALSFRRQCARFGGLAIRLAVLAIFAGPGFVCWGVCFIKHAWFTHDRGAWRYFVSTAHREPFTGRTFSTVLALDWSTHWILDRDALRVTWRHSLGTNI